MQLTNLVYCFCQQKVGFVILLCIINFHLQEQCTVQEGGREKTNAQTHSILLKADMQIEACLSRITIIITVGIS